MDMKLQDFFNAARRRLKLGDGYSPLKPPSKDAQIALLMETAQAEFGPILDVLNNAQDAEGNFEGWISEQHGVAPTVCVDIAWSGALPAELQQQPKTANGCMPGASVCVILEMPQPNNVSITLMNFGVVAESPSRKEEGSERSFQTEKPWSFEEARLSLGDALATIAPGPMARICGTPETMPGISIMKTVRLKPAM